MRHPHCELIAGDPIVVNDVPGTVERVQFLGEQIKVYYVTHDQRIGQFTASLERLRSAEQRARLIDRAPLAWTV